MLIAGLHGIYVFILALGFEPKFYEICNSMAHVNISQSVQPFRSIVHEKREAGCGNQGFFLSLSLTFSLISQIEIGLSC